MRSDFDFAPVSGHGRFRPRLRHAELDGRRPIRRLSPLQHREDRRPCLADRHGGRGLQRGRAKPDPEGRRALVTGRVNRPATSGRSTSIAASPGATSSPLPAGRPRAVTGAKLDNGLLAIELQRELPEEKKPRSIAIEAEAAAADHHPAVTTRTGRRRRPARVFPTGGKVYGAVDCFHAWQFVDPAGTHSPRAAPQPMRPGGPRFPPPSPATLGLPHGKVRVVVDEASWRSTWGAPCTRRAPRRRSRGDDGGHPAPDRARRSIAPSSISTWTARPLPSPTFWLSPRCRSLFSRPWRLGSVRARGR